MYVIIEKHIKENVALAKSTKQNYDNLVWGSRVLVYIVSNINSLSE